MPVNRRENAYRIRVDAAEMARSRTHPEHLANGDEQRYANAKYAMSFTEGLEHDDLGLVQEPEDFEAFRTAIDQGFIDPFTTRVPVPTKEGVKRRQWEAPTAGTAYELQGPDAQAVTMPPAPELGSDELAFEMAEVYELALLRDVPLASFSTAGGPDKAKIDAACGRLQAMDYAGDEFPGRPRKTDEGALTRQKVFRGSSPGVDVGPYLSQFMLIGNDTRAGTTIQDGFIEYGAQLIDQRVPVARSGEDHMQTWNDWKTVQDGFDVNRAGLGKNDTECSSGQNFDGGTRFIYTPRDLATYVHFDALYQAYLNATIILLGMGTPFDPGFAHLSGQNKLYSRSGEKHIDRNAGGFALYGGPHILTLVTEVATRALKAVRFQKFNNHLRLRPEALAARIHLAKKIDEKYPSTCGAFTKLDEQLAGTVEKVRTFNGGTALLPMAFAEGSPMHPTYGAGHATVAGACTTIVKAFFDTGTVLGRIDSDSPCDKDKADKSKTKIGFFRNITDPIWFEAPIPGSSEPDKLQLVECPMKTPDPDDGDKDGSDSDKPTKIALTLEGELNKLAANISIGRNMAGVHYFSDYFDSLRMGEAIAIGMLQEQALCYPTDEFVLHVPTFDGGNVRIGRK